MVATLAIFGLVVDDAILNFDLSDAEVALEIGGIVLGIPQAEFRGGKHRQLSRRQALVRNR